MQNKKIALITGASSGIGEAIAVKFAEKGHDLVLSARRIERLETLSTQLKEKYNIKVYCYQVDVTKRSEVERFATSLFDKNIVPYFLINNAGLAAGKDKLQNSDIENWERMIDTNLKGVLYITRTFLPKMIEANQGHVVFIGSTAGHIVYPEGNVYNVTKFGVKALNEGTNLDLVGTNIKCTSIDPGACETEFSLVRFDGDKSKANSVYKGFTPLSPIDVADAVDYVCSTPPHVNITSLVLYPTAQRSVYVIDRKS